MNKFVLFLTLSFTFLMACKNTQPEKPADESQAIEKEISNLDSLLAQNPKIQIGEMVTKTIQQKVNCTGKVEIPPSELISIHSKIMGTIQYMKYLPGDYIKKGDLLFKVSNPELVQKQRIFLEIKEDKWMAENDYKRKQMLSEENAVTGKTYDEAKSLMNRLQASYKGLRAELALFGINVDELEKETNYQSSVPIYATHSGFVQTVYINYGQMIQPEDKLMDMASGHHVHLELQVLAKDVPLLKIGQKVDFILPKNEKILHAELVKLNPVMDEASGTLMVHCHIEKEDCSHIIPGMFVNASIQVSDREVKGLQLDAVIKEGEQYFAFIIDQDALQKHQLTNVEVFENFITFDPFKSGKMVTAGAYYLE